MTRLRTLIAALCIMTGVAVANAQPMSYMAMRNNARFLTDRMAYTLGITSLAIIDDIYRINYDYICGVNDYLDDVALGYYYDDYMAVCYERDNALRFLLGDVLWASLIRYDYFHRPIVFANRGWHFGIYSHMPYNSHFYYAPPSHYHSYRGGHFFHNMRPAGSPGIGRRNGGAVAPGRRGDAYDRGGSRSYENRRTDSNRRSSSRHNDGDYRGQSNSSYRGNNPSYDGGSYDGGHRGNTGRGSYDGGRGNSSYDGGSSTPSRGNTGRGSYDGGRSNSSSYGNAPARSGGTPSYGGGSRGGSNSGSTGGGEGAGRRSAGGRR